MRDSGIAGGETESLIKLHLVKQTSLHSSRQSRRTDVVVRGLTETNLELGQTSIVCSTLASMDLKPGHIS